MMKNKNVKIQYWILYWILSRIRWIFQLTYICTIMIQYRHKYYCNMYFLKLNTTLVYDILYLLLCINYYYAYSTLLHILSSTGFYTGSYYLLDFILDNWWILSEMSKLDQKPVLDFHWILYWIIGGFLLNIKSTRFYVKSTRFPHLVLQ